MPQTGGMEGGKKGEKKGGKEGGKEEGRRRVDSHVIAKCREGGRERSGRGMECKWKR